MFFEKALKLVGFSFVEPVKSILADTKIVKKHG
jgi:hypothetical protein